MSIGEVKTTEDLDKLYEDILDFSNKPKEERDQILSENTEYAYMIVVPDPFKVKRGIKRDVSAHLTTWDSMYWIKIGDGSDILERTSDYNNPSQFISIIKLPTVGRPPEDISDEKQKSGKKKKSGTEAKRDKAGKFLENKVLKNHICGGMFPGRGSSEWHALYSNSGVKDSDSKLNRDLRCLLHSFFPLSDLLKRKKKLSGVEFREVLNNYLKTSKEKAHGWTEVIDRITLITAPSKGSIGKDVAQKEAPKEGWQIPRIYIIVTPSTRVESRYTYLGMDDGSVPTVSTYWIKVGYSCAADDSVKGLITSQYGTKTPSLHYNGYDLKDTLKEEEKNKELLRVWNSLENMLSQFHVKIGEEEEEEEKIVVEESNDNNDNTITNEKQKEKKMALNQKKQDEAWIPIRISGTQIDTSKRPAAIALLNEYINSFDIPGRATTMKAPKEKKGKEKKGNTLFTQKGEKAQRQRLCKCGSKGSKKQKQETGNDISELGQQGFLTNMVEVPDDTTQGEQKELLRRLGNSLETGVPQNQCSHCKGFLRRSGTM